MVDAVQRNPSRLVIWTLLLGVFFLALASGLPLMPFTDSMESFNVLTALEVVRDGNWGVPTLWGYPRLQKPPLIHWLSAIGILAGGPLEFSARWLPLLLTCLTLIVVYEWARLFANWKTALLAAVIVGSSIGFMRFSKRASYDAQLMFWVSLTNLALSWALFQRRFVAAGIVGSIALGGALMTKGPPSLLHTVLPFAVFCGISAIRGRRQDLGRNALLVVSVTCVSALFLAPWVLSVIAKCGGVGSVLETWRIELSRENERLVERMTTPPWEALVFLGLLAPWTIWYIGAIVEAVAHGYSRWRRSSDAAGTRHWFGPGIPHAIARPLAFLLTMSLLPVAIHAFIPPMRDRYLLPMIPAAAIASALILALCLKRLQTRQATRADLLAIAGHVIITLAIAAGHPLAAAWDTDNPISLTFGIGLSISATVIVASGVMLQRRFVWAIVLTTVLAMLQAQAVFSWHDSFDVRECETVARKLSQMPDIHIAAYVTDRPPRAFAIYYGKRIGMIGADGPIPAGHVLITRRESPAGFSRVGQFKDGRHLWSLWQLPASASTIPATYGK